MAVIEDTEHPYPRPLSGAKVERLPSALVPARTALNGRYVTLEPLMQRGMRVICSRRRMEARPRFTSGTICRGAPGNPKRSS